MAAQAARFPNIVHAVYTDVLGAARTIALWPERCAHNDDPDQQPRVDIYMPPDNAAPGDAARPVVVICPGGGYSHLAAREGPAFARVFAGHGYVAAVCYYRHHPHRFPAPYADAARAIRLVRHMAGKLNIDPQRLALLGFSAGGHNASTVAVQPDLHHDEHDDLVDAISARPDRLILAYAVISMTGDYHRGSAMNLLGQTDPPEDRRRALSNELHVGADTPPTFLFHTDGDTAVPMSNSIRFAQACRARGVPVDMHIYHYDSHGCGLAEDIPVVKTWPRLMLDWLSTM